MNEQPEKAKVIFSHSGGPKAVIARVAEELRKAFPTCDVMEIENPPPCVRCGLPAVCQVDGADLCPKCGEVKIEPVVSDPAANSDYLQFKSDAIDEIARGMGFPDSIRGERLTQGIKAARDAVEKFANIIDTPDDKPKYANRATRRHAEDRFAYEPDTRRQIRGCSMPTGRNSACVCGSGRKFKKCHGKPFASIPANAA